MDIKKTVTIRPTVMADLDRAMAIYEAARERMALGGNPRQWVDGYPSRQVIADDIARGTSHVIEIDGRIAGIFTFILGNDPTYEVIDGQWLNDRPYGTIHRIASAPGEKGIADLCLAYCRSLIGDIRIDTHRDNRPMLGWIESRGFSYCGIIACHNGTPRKAYQLTT